MARWTRPDFRIHDVRMATDVYDDCIAYLDRRLGLLLDELSRRGVLENTLVIVTSDHGEHLGDHLLFFHGCSLYRQLVQVPLLIVGNKGVPAGRTVAEPVSLCDIPATIIDLLGLGRDHALSWPIGCAVLATTESGSSSCVPEPLFMETTKPEVLANRRPRASRQRPDEVAGRRQGCTTSRWRTDRRSCTTSIQTLKRRSISHSKATTVPVLVEFRNLLDLMQQRR